MNLRRALLATALIMVMAASLTGGMLIGRDLPHDATGWGQAPAEVRAVMWPEPRALAKVVLTTQHGERFTNDDLRGHWSLVFFGYMSCPDVCPTSLQAMREMRKLLDTQDALHNVQTVFVTVDPQHDRPDEMADYLAWYDPALIGLHGTEDEIARLADSLAVKYLEFNDETGYRSIDHTASLMVIAPDGRMVGALPPPLEPQRMTEQFLRLVEYLGHG
ncbi:MAG: SCO family protein [Pseudomonadota bacterium]|nr:MAG: SCO family protein [Pseudomonadota bacterium]